MHGPQSHHVGFPGEVLLYALIIMSYGCLQLQPDPPPSQALPPWPSWEPEPRWAFQSFTMIIVSVPPPCAPTHPRPGLLLNSALGQKTVLRTRASKEGPSTHEMQEKPRSPGFWAPRARSAPVCSAHGSCEGGARAVGCKEQGSFGILSS